jgi:HAD superfamily hydrolase (TIGR01509 family)
MIRAVLFDLDGVVRHFFPEHVAGIERRHRLPLGSIEAFAFSHPLIDEVTTGRMTRSEWIAAIGEHLSNPAAAGAWDAQPYRTDPRVLELARELKGLGLITAILTNGTDTIPAEADRLGLVDVFDAIFNSASIGYAKPDERAFQHVLDVLGLPGRNLFFTDDSPSKLSGAAALGMITHHFTGPTGLRMSLRDHGINLQA